jgi:hypothetical protein
MAEEGSGRGAKLGIRSISLTESRSTPAAGSTLSVGRGGPEGISRTSDRGAQGRERSKKVLFVRL